MYLGICWAMLSKLSAVGNWRLGGSRPWEFSVIKPPWWPRGGTRPVVGLQAVSWILGGDEGPFSRGPHEFQLFGVGPGLSFVCWRKNQRFDIASAWRGRKRSTHKRKKGQEWSLWGNDTSTREGFECLCSNILFLIRMPWIFLPIERYLQNKTINDFNYLPEQRRRTG